MAPNPAARVKTLSSSSEALLRFSRRRPKKVAITSGSPLRVEASRLMDWVNRLAINRSIAETDLSLWITFRISFNSLSSLSWVTIIDFLWTKVWCSSVTFARFKVLMARSKLETIKREPEGFFLTKGSRRFDYPDLPWIRMELAAVIMKSCT